MLFRDFKKAYVNFCEEEILREIALAKRRYLRKEHVLKSQCTLNTKVASGLDAEKIDLEIGDYDVRLEDFLPLEEIVEDENIAKNMKLLSDREKKVVSLRLEEGLSIKEINIVLGTKRINTPVEIFSRAMKKLKDGVNDEKGE
ncbi:hypothetical protein IKO18_02810 [bacterium]|nr:hypothetical protein [bacterium]